MRRSFLATGCTTGRTAPLAVGRALACLLALAAWSACTEPTDWSVTSEPEPQGSVESQAAPLIQRVATAPTSVVYQGERRIEAEVVAAEQVRRLVLLERVTSDGQGGFAIEPLDVIEPVLPQPREELVLAVQKLREGLHFRYRDFAVRNLGLFLRNYTVTDTSSPSQVAGRACAEWIVERAGSADRRFLVSVDLETALVLRAVEQDLSGHTIARMEFLSLSLNPVSDTTDLHVPLNAERPLELQNAAQELGFALVEPSLVPSGFELAERTRVTEPDTGAHWAKLTFSDGLEQVFYLHGGPLDGANGMINGWPVEPDEVRWLAAPPWNLLQGNVHGHRMLAAGKVNQLELMRMLESAMP